MLLDFLLPLPEVINHSPYWDLHILIGMVNFGAGAVWFLMSIFGLARGDCPFPVDSPDAERGLMDKDPVRNRKKLRSLLLLSLALLIAGTLGLYFAPIELVILIVFARKARRTLVDYGVLKK